MQHYQTLDQFEEDYLRNHSDDLDRYIQGIFAEYEQHQDIETLLDSLRIIARVKGVSALAKSAGITRQGLQRALSAKGNPRFDTLVPILRGIGYRLTVTPISSDVYTP